MSGPTAGATGRVSNQFPADLLLWFARNQRELPWRQTYAPYHVWISEIMLQQTQVSTVVPYYRRWMARFPEVPAVARADRDELLKLWEGMGYYDRALNIQKTAGILVRDFAGEIPEDHNTLLSFPGIGPYTAGAIMSLAFNREYPVVDGNVERVLARVLDLSTPVKTGENRVLIRETARELIPAGRARSFNQALMELGALVCRSKQPRCPECPVAAHCTSLRLGTVAERPVRVSRRRPRRREVAVGVLVRAGKVFIQKRPPGGLMPGLWEFPGGKVEPGETPEEALAREFREELLVKVRVLDKIGVIQHSYTSFRVTLRAFFCELEDEGARPALNHAVEGRWVAPQTLGKFAFPAANTRLIELLGDQAHMVMRRM